MAMACGELFAESVQGSWVTLLDLQNLAPEKKREVEQESWLLTLPFTQMSTLRPDNSPGCPIQGKV